MTIKLKAASLRAKDLSSAIQDRFSCRSFKDRPLNLDDVSAVLWAACGRKADAVTGATRTIPSAGAAYPLELYLVCGKDAVNNLAEGLYHYDPENHSLDLLKPKDIRKELALACLKQSWVASAPASIVIAAEFDRTAGRYGSRGERYVYMESGHAAQNVYLAADCLGLGTTEVGAFDDELLKETLELPQGRSPLLVMPIGYPGR